MSKNREMNDEEFEKVAGGRVVQPFRIDESFKFCSCGLHECPKCGKKLKKTILRQNDLDKYVPPMSINIMKASNYEMWCEDCLIKEFSDWNKNNMAR